MLYTLYSETSTRYLETLQAPDTFKITFCKSVEEYNRWNEYYLNLEDESLALTCIYDRLSRKPLSYAFGPYCHQYSEDFSDDIHPWLLPPTKVVTLQSLCDTDLEDPAKQVSLERIFDRLFDQAKAEIKSRHPKPFYLKKRSFSI